MIVSLEAIFLSTFVLISQNRLSEETERRADLNLQIGLLTEHELTRVLQMLDAIQDKMGIVDHQNSELADLEMETRPEDVLAEIHRLQTIELGKKKPPLIKLQTNRHLKNKMAGTQYFRQCLISIFSVPAHASPKTPLQWFLKPRFSGIYLLE